MCQVCLGYFLFPPASAVQKAFMNHTMYVLVWRNLNNKNMSSLRKFNISKMPLHSYSYPRRCELYCSLLSWKPATLVDSLELRRVYCIPVCDQQLFSISMPAYMYLEVLCFTGSAHYMRILYRIVYSPKVFFPAMNSTWLSWHIPFSFKCW